MTRALVTGATGFVGGHLIRALLGNGWKVAAALRTPARGEALDPSIEKRVVGELAQPHDWTEAVRGADVVFHLAGKAHDTAAADPAELYRAINVDATAALAGAAKAAGVRRIVYFSSVKAAEPQTPYGASKRDAEALLLESQPLEAVCLRPALIYGPGQKGNLMRLVRQIDRGVFPALTWADNRRSMVHIDNVVAAALLAAEAPQAAGKIYTVTDKEPYSTARLCRAIRQALGREDGWDVPRPALRAAARVGDLLGKLRGRPFPFDSEAFEKLFGNAEYSCKDLLALGYAPRARLEDAIDPIVEAYRAGLR